MNILFRENIISYNNALTKANKYWGELGYEKIRKNIKKNNRNTVFYCDQYGIFVNRYAISVDTHYGKLSEKDKGEIRTIIGYFVNKSHMGYVDKFSSLDSEDLIDCVLSIDGVTKTSSIITCDWSREDIGACLEFVRKIPKNTDNKKVLDTLSSILLSLEKNT